MNNHDPKLYFLVDDHPMVREGLINLLKTAGFTLAGQADNCSETLQHPHSGINHSSSSISPSVRSPGSS